MIDFTFALPTKVLFGKDQLKKLGTNIKKYGDRVLLAYGGGSIKKIGLYDEITKILRDEGIFFKELSGIEPNPKIDKVREGIKIIRDNDLNFILAVGGGSVIDSAKLIAPGVFAKGDPWDLVLKKEKITDALKIGVVLTIAATGSETDNIGVISNDKTNEKLSIAGKELIPAFAILNPEYTFSVNPYQTGAGSADIISHTLENYLTLDEGCFLQNKFAEAILKTIIKYGPIAVKDGSNYEARANIMWASSWAINGLLDKGKDTDWTVHSMEHELSAYYDITHGVGLAILTPRFLEYILNDKTVKMIKNFGINAFGLEDSGDDFKDARLAIKRLFDFFKDELKLPMSLRELGIDDKYFEEMAERQVARRGGRLNGVWPLNKDDIVAIYKKSLDYEKWFFKAI